MDEQRTHVLSGRPSAAPTPIATLVTKIGGDPCGLNLEDWPRCAQCGAAMDFLLQIDLKRPLRLSDRFAMAYFFMCHGYLDQSRGCNTWDPEIGANRLVVLSQPHRKVAPAPHGGHRWPEYKIDFGRYITPEEEEDAQQSNRDEKVQRFIDALAAADRTGRKLGEFLDLPKPQTIMIGGEPDWLQAPEMVECPVCHGPVRLLAEIDGEIDKHYNGIPGLWFPFGGAGIAYSFLCEAECSPLGASLLWQTS